MAQFIASTRDIEDLLVRLHDLVQSGGGMIHEEARLCERDGDFSIEAPATIGARQPLIEVPGNLLVPPAWFGLHLAGDELQIGEVDPRASMLQTELMEVLVALYNLTGKVKHHRETSTYSIYKSDFELFSKLAFPDQIRVREDAENVDALLQDFLRTRVLSVPQSVLGGGGDGAVDAPIDVLMPIIDFLNHHPRAGGYNLVGGKLIAVRGFPDPGSEECFICYGRHDAQSLLFTYGYLHEGLPFTFSKPMQTEVRRDGVARGTLAIFRSGAGMRDIPEALRDVGWILPAFSIDEAKDLVQAAYLPIYADAPLTVTRRLLEAVVPAFMGQGAAPSAIADESARIEREIVSANIDHYTAAKDLLASREKAPETALAFDAVSRMIELQLNLLQTYSRSIT